MTSSYKSQSFIAIDFSSKTIRETDDGPIVFCPL